MEPLFFGTSAEPLYGVYHPPGTPAYRDEAVLLCYPAGQEYMRIHRAYRQLANMLTQNGYHVFRFDYRGTGDSAGNPEQMTSKRWLEDAEAAVDELQALSGVNRLSIVGVRLGSVVAAELGSKIGAKQVVLWEPYPEPYSHFLDIEQLEDRSSDQCNFSDGNGGWHFNGFHYSAGFRDSFKGQSLASLGWQPGSRVLIVTAEESERARSLEKALLSRSVDVSRQTVECLADWNHLDALGGLFLPQGTLTAIVNWILGEGR